MLIGVNQETEKIGCRTEGRKAGAMSLMGKFIKGIRRDDRIC